ncbi:MAG: LacI family DNA-binding transcriptional regulator [Victivallaceae bacterium]
MKKKITIRDVARHAGTSVGTVSNVLNGLRCSQKLRERINKSVSELKYTQNMYAKAVRSARTNCIGILIDKRSETNTPWIQSLVLDIIQTLSNYKYRNMIEYWDPCSQFQPQLLSNVDGLIIIGNFNDDFFHIVENNYSFPVITYWNDIPIKRGAGVPVNINNGIRKAVEHLLLLGHSQIAYLGAAGNSVNCDKINAFISAMKLYGREVDENCMEYFENIPGSLSEIGYQGTLRLLKKMPDVTALLYGSDCYAMGGMGALASLRLKVPDDISVISFDNSYWAENTRPGITSIGFQIPLIPVLVELLMKMIDEPDIDNVKNNIVPAELDIFIRQSTEHAKQLT